MSHTAFALFLNSPSTLSVNILLAADNLVCNSLGCGPAFNTLGKSRPRVGLPDFVNSPTPDQPLVVFFLGFFQPTPPGGHSFAKSSSNLLILALSLPTFFLAAFRSANSLSNLSNYF